MASYRDILICYNAVFVLKIPDVIGHLKIEMNYSQFNEAFAMVRICSQCFAVNYLCQLHRQISDEVGLMPSRENYHDR